MPIRSWGDLLNDAGGAGDSFEPLPSGDYDFEISQAVNKVVGVHCLIRKDDLDANS